MFYLFCALFLFLFCFFVISGDDDMDDEAMDDEHKDRNIGDASASPSHPIILNGNKKIKMMMMMQ